MLNLVIIKPAFKTILASLSIILIALISTAQAFQTLNNQNTFVSGYSNFSYTQQRIETFKLTDDQLARLGREIIKPTTVPAIPTNPRYNKMKSLPGVPTAVLMVLFGFICISLIRDRRIWLAAIRSMTWIGQFYAKTIPQLTKQFYLRTQINKYLSAKHPLRYMFKNLTRPRCDIEGTRYIGLLHYLAGIPANKIMSYLYPRIAASNKFVVAEFALSSNHTNNISILTIKPFISYKRILVSNNSSRAPPPLSI